MNNIKNNEELKDNNNKVEPLIIDTNKKETGTKSIIFLPFDLNVSNPGITNPYTRIISKKSPGKRNKLSDILKDPNEKVKGFKDAINRDNFQPAVSIIDTSKYLDFIANNFNYSKKTNGTSDDSNFELGNEDGNIGFLDWYEKNGSTESYFILPKSESHPVPEHKFKIEKFGIILNELARSGSIMIEITWMGEGNKMELLSEIDFFRFHDDENKKYIEEIKTLKTEFYNNISEEILPFLQVYKPKEINPNSVRLSGQILSTEIEIAEMGFCCSKNSPPSISDKVINPKDNQNSKGFLNVPLENLDQDTTYYYCAYFKDSNEKISYGSVQSFTTSSIDEERKETCISDIIKANYSEIKNLIYFNHKKPTVVHLIRDSQAFEIDDEKMSKLIYKTLRIPAKPDTLSNIPHKINYSEIVKLQSPDENISFATMNEGVLIIDNTIHLNELTKKYLPAFILALNQREFLLKVIRLAPYVDLKNLQELKDLKKFVTEVYLKQISFTVSVYNEIDILFAELQEKFDIEILMRDNKESINEIHQLIEGLDKEKKAEEDKAKDDADKVKSDNLNYIILALTIIQAISIFYTLFNDLLGNGPFLFGITLLINCAIIIGGIYYIFKSKNNVAKHTKTNNLIR